MKLNKIFCSQNFTLTNCLYGLLILELALIYFFVPAGRFHSSFSGYSFSFGGDVYKNFAIPILTWLAWRKLNRSSGWPFSLLHPPFLFLILISIISSAGSRDPYQAFSETLELILYYGFFLILIDIPWSRKSFLPIAISYLLGTIWMGCVTGWQFLHIGDSAGIPGLNGTFLYPNYLGLFCILSLTLLTFYEPYCQTRLEKICIYTSIVITLLCSLLTISRATYLGLMVWLWIVFRAKTIRVPFGLKIGMVALVIASLVVIPFIAPKFYGILDEFRGDDPYSRIQIWPFVLDFSIPDFTYFGYGQGPVLKEIMDSTLAAEFKPDYLFRKWHPHNLFLSIFLYMGIPGLFALGWLFLIYFWQIRFCNPYPKVVLLAGMTGYIVHQFFDEELLEGNIPVALISLLALATIFSRRASIPINEEKTNEQITS